MQGPRQKLVVIGNGMAGARTIEEILERDRDRFEIVVFGDEPYGNYNRILLSNVLNGSHDAKAVFLNPLSWYAENDITLHAGVRVCAIDREARTVTGANGIVEPYDLLILATGSAPFVPPIPGTDKGGVFVFRTLDDCSRIADWAGGCHRAVVLGGGLLGLEAARGLMTHGAEVTVLEAAPHLMPQQLDAEAGAMLAKTMEGMGVQVVTDARTTEVLGNGHVEGVQLADGSTLDCELIVISCGIRANSELAHSCGLAVERGILVDDRMRTSDASIYAVGECAQHRGVVYGLVAPLYEQARVLADLLTHTNLNAEYTGSKSATKLKVMGVELASMGVTQPRDEHDEVISFAEPKRGIYKRLIIREGVLVGGILLGDTAKAQPLMHSFDRALPLPEERASLLFDMGTASSQMPMLEMPDDTQICNCNGVSKETIRKCVSSGKRNLKAVMEKTRAGTGCGSCKLLVRELVEWACEGQMDEDPSIHYYVPGVPLAKPELVEQILARGLKSVSSVFAAFAGGKDDPGSKPGLASLLKSLWHDQYEDERDSRFINDRVHANIQKDATFSVVPRMYGGITTPAELRRIADVADKYNVPMVKVTGGQRLDLLGVKKEDLPDMWRDLGMPSGHAYAKAFRTCKTCVGTEFCRYGVGDSTTLGIRIERRFQGIEFPHKVKTAVSGCPRNCAEATVKDIGVVAVEGGWEIYVGGAAGSRVRAADLLARVGTHDEAILLVGRFMQYYREHGKYLERAAGMIERLGIDHIRNVVVDDTQGIAARLDAAIQAAVDSYVDPWEEANEPVHPAQFRGQTIIPLDPIASAPGIPNEPNRRAPLVAAR